MNAACRWIGTDDWRDDALALHDHPFVFVRRLAPGDWQRARTLNIACCLRYAVFVNGRLVHDGPARGLPGEAYVDTVPLTSTKGGEWLAVILLPPTGTPASEVHMRIGFIAELELAGGPSIVTDGEWTVRPFDEVRFAGRLCSLPTSQQEHWSLATPPVDAWRRPGKPARVLGSAGTPLWRALLPRDCALMTRAAIPRRIVFSGRDGAESLPTGSDFARAFNGRDVTAVESFSGDAEQAFDAARNLVTFDVGRTRRVRPVIDVLQASGGGGQVEVFYDIGFDGRPRASLGFEHEREGFCDSFTLAPELAGQSWQPLVPRGTRYVTVRYAGGGDCRLRVGFEARDYPAVAAACPAFGRPALREIWRRSVNTLRSSCDDVLVDTCWRENVLWTFDAAYTGEAHYLAFGDATMWRRCLGLIARWAKLRGAWPTSVVPAGASGMILPDQSLGAIAAIDAFVRRTGDAEFAQEHVPMFEPFLSACLDHVTEDGLFVPPDWCWHWIDWAPIDRRPYSLPVNLLLLGACETAARWGGPGAFATRCRAAIERLHEASEKFWDESAGCYRDRLAPPRPMAEPNQAVPMPTADVSAHANALALSLRLGGGGRCARVADFLAAGIQRLPFSPGWTGLILGALVEHGRAEAAIAHLERLYRPWLDADQPTWSEGFGQTVYNTAHGWGASALTVLAQYAAETGVEGERGS